MELTEVKKEIKARKPRFIRTDAHKKKRVGNGWRKPKGIQNKMRLHKKGYRKTVKPGYGAPLPHTSQGKEIIKIATQEELVKLNPKTQAAELMKVGRKRKDELIEQAQQLQITIINLSVERYKERSRKNAEEKKKKKEEEAKKAAEEKKVQEKKDQEKKAAIAQAKEEEAKAQNEIEQTEEEKKEEDKKEKDKILTSKKGY